MRKGVPLVLSLAIIAAGLIPAIAAATGGVDCEDVAPEPLAFHAPQFIDTTRAGGEPVTITTPDGAILVSAHAGTTHAYKDPTAGPGGGDFAVGYANQTLNWRSTDGGQTWKFVGLAGQENGPHSLSSTGFSDPDFAIDQGGRIYNVEIDLANVAVFSSPDFGKSWPTANPEASFGDRPWLTGQEPNEVFLYVNLPKQLWRSTDGGVTFSLVTTSLPATGKMISDPLNPQHGLIAPVGVQGIAMSGDDGKTWKQYPDAGLGRSTQFFGVPAVDNAGNVYVAAAGGYTGTDDTVANGEVTFNYFDRATEEWGEPIEIPTPPGDALWPWVIAGDDGRVSVVWYQTLQGDQNRFYIYAAQTLNGHGSTVTCDDGSTREVAPQFEVANASGRPVHMGKICLDGTTCNANTSFEGGDRRLGDFFTVNFDLFGNLYIASGDTTLRGPTGGPKPVSNPIFIRQLSGSPMLEAPIAPIEPRDLCEVEVPTTGICLP
ncbi:MAG: hypothetical protein JJE05_07260 [Actinobacteria bacterium]|nr:hypothetical protein [Actinomycetota bacterium]